MRFITVKNSQDKCPKCGSKKVFFTDCERGDDYLIRHGRCEKCNEQISEYYKTTETYMQSGYNEDNDNYRKESERQEAIEKEYIKRGGVNGEVEQWEII